MGMPDVTRCYGYQANSAHVEINAIMLYLAQKKKIKPNTYRLAHTTKPCSSESNTR